jgi:LacI family transcriptional regulator
MKSVSIKDIATEVGVSTTTVSFVLNGKAREKRISEELKEKILLVAARLHYRPNQVARGLRTGQTHTLGLMVEDISNPFFARLAKVVEDEADKAGYRVIFCSTENKEEKASALLSMLKHRQMDGFIITPTQGMVEEIRDLAGQNRPFVLVDRFFPELDTSYVAVDNYNSSREGVKLMLDKGSRRIALVTVDSEQQQMQERYRGYADALRANGMGAEAGQVLKVPFPVPHEQAVALITGFLRGHPDMDGVFFTTNYLGVAGLEAIRAIGKKIPTDLRLLCFDDNDLFRIGTPSITVIAQPIEKIGETAVRMLVDMLAAKDVTATKQTLKPKLIIRDSI